LQVKSTKKKVEKSLNKLKTVTERRKVEKERIYQRKTMHSNARQKRKC
jgi:hypothetical protein